MSSWNQSLNRPFQLSVILCFFPFCRCFCRQGPTLSDAGPVAGLPPSRTSALRRHFTFKLISIIRKINPSPSPVCQHHQPPTFPHKNTLVLTSTHDAHTHARTHKNAHVHKPGMNAYSRTPTKSTHQHAHVLEHAYAMFFRVRRSLAHKHTRIETSS